MKKVVKNIVKYLIELVIVAFGVFLGVYFSTINTEKKTKADKTKSLEIIVSELEYNQKLLTESINYHDGLIVQIDSIEEYSSFPMTATMGEMDSEFLLNKIKGWKGFEFARLQTTAFEGTKISGILKEFNIELIQKISISYESQETYIDFGTSLFNKAISMDSSTKVVDVIGLIDLMTYDLLTMEEKLNLELKNTISELKSMHDDSNNY